MQTTAAQKRQLRDVFRQRIAGLSREQREGEAREVCDALLRLKGIAEAPSLLCYLAFGDELNLDHCIRRLLKLKKDVYAPRISGDGRGMEFFRIEGELSDLPLNPYGIREPEAGAAPFRPPRGGLPVPMIIPGLCFDIRGRRLGRGGGFYDRYLERYRSSLFAVAVAYNLQLLPDIPYEPHDAPVDYFIASCIQFDLYPLRSKEGRGGSCCHERKEWKRGKSED